MKSVKNQELAYKLVWMACKKKQLELVLLETPLPVIGSGHRGQGCAPGQVCPAGTCIDPAQPCWA